MQKTVRYTRRSPQGASRQWERCCGDRDRICGVDCVRQFLEEYVVVAKEVCCPLDQYRDITVKDLVGQRE